MSQPYQFNFQGMARFFDDFKYILQRGGGSTAIGGIQGKSGVEKILLYVKFVITIIIICFVCWILYIIIVGGYMRFLTPTLFHKEDMNGFIKENNVLVRSFKSLFIKTEECSDPYDAFETLFSQSISDYYLLIKNLDTVIKENYSEFKYDEQIYEAFKDYYLYYNLIDVSKQTSEPLPTAKGTVTIKNKEFYEQRLGILINTGQYDTHKKSDDQQLIDVHNADKNQKFYNRVVNVKIILEKLAQISSQLSKTINNNPYTAFIVIPENETDIKAINNDLQKFEKELGNNTIYNQNSEDLNDFSWCIIEYKSFIKNPNVYSIYENIINSSEASFNKEDIAAIKKYININPTLKKVAESKIFGRNFKQQDFTSLDRLVKNTPGLDETQKEIEKKVLGSSQNVNSSKENYTTPAFFEFVKKHPIFSHVYFSTEIHTSKKQSFYNNIMKMYDRFATCGSTDLAKNLMINGRMLLLLVNSIIIFDLYINQYRPGIMKTYQDQNYANKFFFGRLFNPYIEDFISNRMGTYAKKTFSGGNWNASFKTFTIKWTKLGQMLKEIITSILKSFDTSVTIEKPQGEEPSS